MKAYLLFSENNYYLMLKNGNSSLLTRDRARFFIETFDSEEHYTIIGNSSFLFDNTDKVEKVAQVDDDNRLTFLSSEHIRKIFGSGPVYLTADEYAEKVGRKPNIVMRMCREKRIPGAMQKGSRWLIPEDAPYPKDARVGRRVQQYYD